jgi:hypothetical protein
MGKTIVRAANKMPRRNCLEMITLLRLHLSNQRKTNSLSRYYDWDSINGYEKVHLLCNRGQHHIGHGLGTTKKVRLHQSKSLNVVSFGSTLIPRVASQGGRDQRVGGGRASRATDPHIVNVTNIPSMRPEVNPMKSFFRAFRLAKSNFFFIVDWFSHILFTKFMLKSLPRVHNQ